MANRHHKRRLKRWLYFPIAIILVLVVTLIFMQIAKQSGLQVVQEVSSSPEDIVQSPAVTPQPIANRLFIFQETDGKYGYIDETGRHWGYHLSAADGTQSYGYNQSETGSSELFGFDVVTNFSEGFALVGNDDGQGLRYSVIDMQGNITASNLLYSEARAFSGGFAAVKNANGWGMIDPYGTEAIRPQYESIGDVKINTVTRQLNAVAATPAGEVIASETPTAATVESAIIGAASDAAGGAATAEIQVTETTLTPAPVQDANVITATTTEESIGVAFVSSNGKYGYVVPADGAEAPPYVALTFSSAQDFSDGLAFVGSIQGDATMSYSILSLATGQSLLNIENAVGTVFSENMAAVQVARSNYVYYSANNQTLITESFLNEQGEAHHFENARNFSEGLAAISVDGLWGFIDNTSYTPKIAAQYRNVMTFSEGIAFVQSNDTGLWGAINTSGQIVMDFRYETVFPAKTDVDYAMLDGYAMASYGGNVYCVDSMGKETLLYKEQAAVVQASQQMQVVTEDGNLNVRSSPVDGQVINKVTDGQIVTVLDTEDGWSHIELSNRITGYVNSSYLQPLAETVVDTSVSPQTSDGALITDGTVAGAVTTNATTTSAATPSPTRVPSSDSTLQEVPVEAPLPEVGENGDTIIEPDLPAE